MEVAIGILSGIIVVSASYAAWIRGGLENADLLIKSQTETISRLTRELAEVNDLIKGPISHDKHST